MRHDDVHLATNEFGREPWEPFVLVLGESVFKGNGLAFDITEFTQARAKLRERNGIGSCAAEKPDPIYLSRLLCVDSERRNNEAERENDREPISRMGTSVEDGCGESSRRPRRAPARRLCAPLPA